MESVIFGFSSSSLLAGKVSLVYTSGAVLFLRTWRPYEPLDFEFHEKSDVGKGAMAAEISSLATYFVHFIVWRENLSISSRNLV